MESPDGAICLYPGFSKSNGANERVHSITIIRSGGGVGAVFRCFRCMNVNRSRQQRAASSTDRVNRVIIQLVSRSKYVCSAPLRAGIERARDMAIECSQFNKHMTTWRALGRQFHKFTCTDVALCVYVRKYEITYHNRRCSELSISLTSAALLFTVANLPSRAARCFSSRAPCDVCNICWTLYNRVLATR